MCNLIATCTLVLEVMLLLFSLLWLDIYEKEYEIDFFNGVKFVFFMAGVYYPLTFLTSRHVSDLPLIFLLFPITVLLYFDGLHFLIKLKE